MIPQHLARRRLACDAASDGDAPPLPSSASTAPLQGSGGAGREADGAPSSELRADGRGAAPLGSAAELRLADGAARLGDSAPLPLARPAAQAPPGPLRDSGTQPPAVSPVSAVSEAPSRVPQPSGSQAPLGTPQPTSHAGVQRSAIPTITEILRDRTGEEMELNDRHLNPQVGRIVRTLGFDRTWVSGEGAHLVDSTGQRYLDLFGGYGVFAVGRNHPQVIEAVQEVMEARTGNLPQLGVTLLSGVLAEQLLIRAPKSVGAMVPANTGTEAVEAAIKISRAATNRSCVLFAEHAFHGLTLGSLSVNGNEEFRSGFGPLLPGCRSVPFGDLEALRSELERGDVAALILEPIQGKGVNLPPDGYLQTAQRLCRQAGAMFICDEVQTGLGRTGRFLALERWGLEPDLICLSKALSGGLVPIGAVLVSRAAFDSVFDGMERAVRHGSTFGGNDLAAAAALATLRIIESDGLVQRADELGALLLELTRPLVDRFEVVADVRGAGLMWAIELGPPRSWARRSVWRALEHAQPGIFSQLVTVPLFHEHHIFCQVAGHRMNVIKALPALVVEEEEIRRFAFALEQVVGQAERVPSAFARFGLRTGRRMLRASVQRGRPARASQGARAQPSGSRLAQR